MGLPQSTSKGISLSFFLIAMDTQASTCFLSKAFVEKVKMAVTPTHRMVNLADGSTAQLDAECVVRVQFKAQGRAKTYYRRVKCMVIEMTDDQDWILGQDWLMKERADLSYETKSVTLHRARVILKPRKDAPRTQLPLLSAIKAKRHLRKAESCCIVHVTEARPNKEQDFGGQSQTMSALKDVAYSSSTRKCLAPERVYRLTGASHT